MQDKISDEPLIPTMTSNTTPSGECSASSVFDNSNYLAWKAFNGSIGPGGNDCWHSASGVATAWLRYRFTNPVLAKRVKMVNRNHLSGISSPKTFDIQGSNNGTEWVTLGSFTNNNNDPCAVTEYNIIDPGRYLYYQMLMKTTNYTGYNIGMLQFYGKS